MKHIFIPAAILCCLFISCSASAQTGWQWGRTSSDTLNSENWLVSVDRSGNAYFSPQGIDPAATFYFGAIGVTEPIVVKVDGAGNFLWAIGAPCLSSLCFTAPRALCTDPSGNLYLLGSYANSVILGSDTLSVSGGNEYFLMKASPSGSILWAKNIMPAPSAFEGIEYETMACDASGDIYITGSFSGTTVTIGTTTLTNMDVSGTTNDIFLAKYDPSGNVLWAKSMGSNENDLVMSLCAAKDGTLYLSSAFGGSTFTVAGHTLAGGGTDLMGPLAATGKVVAKLNAVGNVEWLKRLPLHMRVNDMVLDTSQNMYMAGYVDSDVVLGTDTLIAPMGWDHSFFAKYDSSCAYLWGICSPVGTQDQAFSLSLDLCGNLWVAGELWNNMIFSGHAVNAPVDATEPGFIDAPAYLLEYDEHGTYINSVVMRGGGDDAMAISVDNQGNFYVAGDYWQDSLFFNTDTLLPTNATVTPEKIFIAKYNYQTTLCTAELTLGAEPVASVTGGTITLYPNPAQNSLNIASTDAPISQVTIVNLLGQTIYCDLPAANCKLQTIDVTHFPPGIYFVRVNGSVVRKWVKE